LSLLQKFADLGFKTSFVKKVEPFLSFNLTFLDQNVAILSFVIYS
jgi:hypothetical protein